MLLYSIFTLLIVLIVTISLSYSYNKEAFADITAATNTVIPNTPATPPLPLTNPGITNVTQNNPSNPSTTVPTPNSTPVSTPSVVNPDVSLSDTGYHAMALHKQSNLLNDIQKIVHNELLANRMMDVSVKNTQDRSKKDSCQSEPSDSCDSSDSSDSSDSCESDSCDAQKEIHYDMSKYIKKDEIPCWGCSIDY
jgi:hypothetical protein